MRTTSTPLAALLLLLLSLAIPACDDASGQVQEVFDEYIAALQNHDGEAVARIIDPKNLEHYDLILDQARRASVGEIMRLPAVDRYAIGLLRALLKADQLKTMDARAMVKWGCEQGLWALDDPVEFTLGRVTHRRPRASADLIADGVRTGMRMEFVEVDGQWLVNDESLNGWFNRGVDRVAKVLNTTQEAVLLRMISRRAGHQVKGSIWAEPPK